MAQNVTVAGAQYSAVPSVNLPKTGGGTAAFHDTSDADFGAGDLRNGKTGYGSTGKILGTWAPKITNLSVLHVNLGNTSNSNELRTASVTVYGQVNSLVMVAWGYQSSTQANCRRVIKIIHIPNAVTKTGQDRYKFLAANGGAASSAGYNTAEGYIENFNGVSYNYNSSTDQTAITVTLPNSNMTGYAGKPRFSSHYHIFAFYVDSDCSNVNINAVSGAVSQSVGGGTQLMGGNPGGSGELDLMGFDEPETNDI